MPTIEKADSAFAEMLRALRVGIRKSMGQVAREIGVTTVYYSDLENAKKPAPYLGSKVDFGKLAEVLGGDVDDLMKAASRSRRKLRIDLDLNGRSEESCAFAATLARRLNDNSLTAEQIIQLRKVLEKE